MNYFEKIQKSIDYIEENLKEEITLEELSNKAYFSAFHFHRIFQAAVGDTLMDYIRKRRLSRAALDMLSSKKRITDIALDYHFNSLDTFTRAFKKMFGETPAEFRKNNNQIVLFEKKKLFGQNVLIKGGIVMESEIIYKSEFHVVGLECFISDGEYEKAKKEDTRRDADDIAEKFFWSLKKGVPNQVNLNNEICYNYGCNGGYTNMVCVETSSLDNVPEGMTGRIIPANKYAVFTHTFNLTPDKITVRDLDENITQYAYGVWFSQSQYEPGAAYSFEVYDISRLSENITRVSIYIPVKEKD